MHDDFEIKHVRVKRDRRIDIANDVPNVDSAHDSFTSKNNFLQISTVGHNLFSSRIV
jgi:hypothetical protein